MITIYLTILVYTGENVKKENVLTVPEGTKIKDIMDKFFLNQNEWAVLLNGRHADYGRIPGDGDKLVFMPPLSGG
jgi:sulfur carrier protein ThiS